jgi:endonuclease/exonuclease/phosphatase family metal-dependent hydrolase
MRAIRISISSSLRRAAAVALGTVVLLALAGSARAQSGIPTDVAAHWTFDEGAGQIAGDSSVNGNDGTLINSPAWRSAGYVNSALTFNGSNNAVVVASPSAALKPTSAYAISAWVKYGATDTSGGEIATMGDNYALRVQPTGEVKTFFHNASGYHVLIGTGVNTKDNKWHHLVGQYTGSELQIYVDGSLVLATAVSGAIEYTLGGSFSLGQQGTGGTNHNFAGAIDEVRVFGRGLTASEVSALAAEPPISFSVWTLDEGTGQVAADSSGNDNNGVVNGAAWTQSGAIGGALAFNGVSDNVVVSSPSRTLKPVSAYAISAWVKFSATDTSGGEVATMADNYALRVQPTGEVKTFFHNASGYHVLIGTGTVANTNTWRHIVGQYTGSALQVYVDGSLVQQVAVTGPIEYTLGTDFYLGQQGTGGTNHNFNGSIDLVRVYGRALSAAEITAQFQERTTAPPTQTTLTVMQFATYHGGWDSVSTSANKHIYDPDRVVKWILSRNPDIVNLTEIGRVNGTWTPTSYVPPNNCPATDKQDDLYLCLIKARSGQPWYGYWVSDTGSTTATGLQGNLILSRVPITTDKLAMTLSGCGDRESAARAQFTVNGHTFTLIGTHLSPDGFPSTCTSAQPARQSEIDQIQTWDDSAPEDHILVGDFNSHDTSPEMADIRGDYRDEYAYASSQSPSIAIGGSSTRAVGHGTSRIDYVMYSHAGTALTLTQFESVSTWEDALQSEASDHRPVVATYTIR